MLYLPDITRLYLIITNSSNHRGPEQKKFTFREKDESHIMLDMMI